MKRVVICNVPMKPQVEKTVYLSNDKSLPSSCDPYLYPVNSFLSQIINTKDQLKVLLLVKKDGRNNSAVNVQKFKDEMESFCIPLAIEPVYSIIYTDFSQEKTVHTQLMGRIIDEIDDESQIVADITYGPKDLPIVVFSALFFAENYLNCSIDNILYGQALFDGNNVIKASLCDMTSLYYLSSLSNTITCKDPIKARQMISSLLDL